MILLGVSRTDNPEAALYLAEKICNLRIFADDEGKMNRSVLEIAGSALVVSQFTLYADARRGRRPSFMSAAGPDLGERLYDIFCKRLTDAGVPVERGRFGHGADDRTGAHRK